jgi:2-polyprenyl-6-methoxyphenol hydroxylase-like FAD-dependent oxidoreductase
VVGGGPAGAASALALRSRGFSVVVLERSDYRDVRIGETLPPSIRKLLVSLGVWDQFLAEKHSPSYGIRSAWGQDYLYDNDFIFNPYGMGWHVDRARFDAMLARNAERAGAKLYRRAQLMSCAENGIGVCHIELACEKRARKSPRQVCRGCDGTEVRVGPPTRCQEGYLRPTCRSRLFLLMLLSTVSFGQ